MTPYSWPIFALWFVLLAYWALSAARAKPGVRTRGWWRSAMARVAVVALVLAAWYLPAARDALLKGQTHLAGHTLVNALGLALCALGVGLAIVARAYLGRNWGVPMSRKEDPDLVTTGPYRFVRHPIYAGALLAMLGSALAQTLFWVVPLVVFGIYFLYSARREEQLMATQFPGEYPAYRKRTKMLVPFVF